MKERKTMRNAIKEMINGLVENGTVLETACEEGVCEWKYITVYFNAEKVWYCPATIRKNKNNDPARALVLAIRENGKLDHSLLGVSEIRDDEEREVYRFEIKCKR
jgi:hypothetical protein